MTRAILRSLALAFFFSTGAFSQVTSVLVGAGYSIPESPQLAPGQVVTLFYQAIGPLPNGRTPVSASGSAVAHVARGAFGTNPPGKIAAQRAIE